MLLMCKIVLCRGVQCLVLLSRFLCFPRVVHSLAAPADMPSGLHPQSFAFQGADAKENVEA